MQDANLEDEIEAGKRVPVGWTREQWAAELALRGIPGNTPSRKADAPNPVVAVHKGLWSDSDAVGAFLEHAAGRLGITDAWYRIIESDSPDLVCLEIRQ